tara:strand:+ start:5764 stop:6153 length:390 start_codon:yes stop_codon:yes gene_type:complete
MKSKIIAFDLDDTLCYRETKKIGIEKYYECKPIPEMIAVANSCYDDGASIIIYTARGMSTFGGDVSLIYSNLYELTSRQLKEWGVKYDQLVMGKLHYDLLIDDKVKSSFKIKDKRDIQSGLKNEKNNSL